MPKTTVSPHQITHNGKLVWIVRIPSALRKQHRGKTRRFFETEPEAAALAKILNESKRDWKWHLESLPDMSRARIWVCLERLKGDVRALELAVDDWCSRQAVTLKPLIEVVNEFLESKVQANRSFDYLRQLTWSLKLFTAGKEMVPISQIKTEHVLNHVNRNGWGDYARRVQLVRIRTLFNFARKRGYTLADPTDGIEKPSIVQKAPGILTVEECQRLLETCRRLQPGLTPYIAICLFAGVRPHECRRLSMEHVRDGYVRIEAAKSKTRRRRLIEIQPALAAWLELPGGFLPPPRGFHRRWARVRREAKINWSQDCLRHSFCSYALPIFGAAKTALMAGHSEAVLFAHYREIVTMEEAERFWAIRPASYS